RVVGRGGERRARGQDYSARPTDFFSACLGPGRGHCSAREIGPATVGDSNPVVRSHNTRSLRLAPGPAHRAVFGGVAEWLGKGLQNPVHRFNSGPRLETPWARRIGRFGRLAQGGGGFLAREGPGG